MAVPDHNLTEVGLVGSAGRVSCQCMQGTSSISGFSVRTPLFIVADRKCCSVFLWCIYSQDLQPKSTTSQNGVSLDPNLPNALPGPLRLATEQQNKALGYSPQPMSATAATDGTAFAGTPVNKLPGPLRIDATTPFDGPSVSGSEISLIVGTRIATPFFGTGFNFCVGAAPS